MDTFISISIYAVAVLAIVTVVAAGFTFLGIWLSNESKEDVGH